MPTIKGGCVLINRNDKKVALIYRPKLNDYSFPKGHMEEGETVIDCAIRETIEETGRSVKLLKDEVLYHNIYTTPKGEDVDAVFYLAEDLGEYDGYIAEKDKEICEWFDVDKVESVLSYGNLIEMWNSVKPVVETYLK